MRYPCPNCDFAATKASHLKKHVESKHEGVRYPCPECKYAATQKGDLKRHLKNKHKWIQISLKFTMTGGYGTFIILILNLSHK